MKRKTNIIPKIRLICDEVTSRQKKDRFTNDTPEEILKRIPNVKEELDQLFQDAIANGYPQEVSQSVIYGASFPEIDDYDELQEFKDRCGEMEEEFIEDEYAFKMAHLAIHLKNSATKS